MASERETYMAKDFRLKIAMTYDEWVVVARALAEAGHEREDGHLLSAAARIEREIGHPAVAGSLEAASERVFLSAR